MKAKKLVFLFLALLFPVVIFIFLKVFGRNEFNVPVFHQEGRIVAPPGCTIAYTTPYRVADTFMSQLGVSDSDSLRVICFDASLEPAMSRIATEFRNDPVRLVAVTQNTGSIDPQFVRDCVLLMEDNASVSLVDQGNRIRGYYDGSDRDEVDRLIVEIKIILKRY